MMKRPRVMTLMGLVALGACGPSVDPIFGQSYDECVLKNASRGGDEDSRSSTKDICARHFTRGAFSQEESALRGKASIDFASEAGGEPQGPWNLYQPGPPRDRTGARVVNTSSDLIIKQVEITATFFNVPATLRGADTDHKLTRTWKVDEDIPPGDAEFAQGDFENGVAPSRSYAAHYSVTRVLPQAGAATNGLIGRP